MSMSEEAQKEFDELMSNVESEGKKILVVGCGVSALQDKLIEKIAKEEGIEIIEVFESMNEEMMKRVESKKSIRHKLEMMPRLIDNSHLIEPKPKYPNPYSKKNRRKYH